MKPSATTLNHTPSTIHLLPSSVNSVPPSVLDVPGEFDPGWYVIWIGVGVAVVLLLATIATIASTMAVCLRWKRNKTPATNPSETLTYQSTNAVELTDESRDYVPPSHMTYSYPTSVANEAFRVVLTTSQNAAYGIMLDGVMTHNIAYDVGHGGEIKMSRNLAYRAITVGDEGAVYDYATETDDGAVSSSAVPVSLNQAYIAAQD